MCKRISKVFESFAGVLICTVGDRRLTAATRDQRETFFVGAKVELGSAARLCCQHSVSKEANTLCWLNEFPLHRVVHLSLKI